MDADRRKCPNSQVDNCMQMQPINPLGPLVAEAKETQPHSGENFIDSLLAVHGKSDSLRNRKPDCKIKQHDAILKDATFKNLWDDPDRNNGR